MENPADIDIDIDLFRPWPEGAVKGSGQPAERAEKRLARVVSRVVLELKSLDGASTIDGLVRLLNDLTLEMREQFDLFRRLRISAESMIDGADEAAAKLARADVKAATDAISLIVRTLEKIDTLQRQAARERAEAEMLEAESGDHDAIRKSFERMIEQRADERAARLFEDWKREAGSAGPEEDDGQVRAVGPPEG